MALLRRFLFYIIGIGLGVLLVFAFFGDRDFDYAYGPGARVKKTLRTKVIDSTTLRHELLDLSQDSTYYQAIVNGKINFSKSEPRREPCGIYAVFFSHASYAYQMKIENCDTLRVLEVVRVVD